MKEITLNETPVRTARNFQINNIKLKDINYNVNIGNFENTKINGLGSNVNIDENVSNAWLKYGVGKRLEEEIREKANCQKRVTIAKDVKEKIEIIQEFNEENVTLVENIEIVAKENSETNVVIKYVSKLDNAYYHNGSIKLLAEKNAKINLIILNLFNTKSNNFLSIEGKIDDNSKISMTLIDFGGKTSITNCYLDLERKKCKR